MPIKSLQQRAKKAKKEGVPPAIRDTDLGRAAKSRHAAKKSRSIRARAGLDARNVSRKKAPGEGKAARRQADYPRPAGEPARPRNRARERMAGTDLRAPKIGTERSTREVPF
jgi:hypothetical protein